MKGKNDKQLNLGFRQGRSDTPDGHLLLNEKVKITFGFINVSFFSRINSVCQFLNKHLCFLHIAVIREDFIVKCIDNRKNNYRALQSVTIFYDSSMSIEGGELSQGLPLLGSSIIFH